VEATQWGAPSTSDKLTYCHASRTLPHSVRLAGTAGLCQAAIASTEHWVCLAWQASTVVEGLPGYAVPGGPYHKYRVLAVPWLAVPCATEPQVQWCMAAWWAR